MKGLCGVILCWNMVMAQMDTVDVYILSGQSNMLGQGSTAELPDSMQTVIEGAFIWSAGSFQEFDAMVKGGFGPEVPFAANYVKLNSDRAIYLIKQAVGGRSLYLGWDNQQWMGTEPGPDRDNYYPGESLSDPNIGNHYRELSDMFLAALDNLDQENIPYVIKGILWLQGEQDAKGVESATTYAQNLKHFSDRIHEDLGVLDTIVPLIYGQVLPYEPALERFTHRVELRQSQADADRDSGHEDSFENAYMISTDEAALKNDNVHYNTEGLLLIGSDFAQEMILAQQEMQVVSVMRILYGNSLTTYEKYYDMLGRIQLNRKLNNRARHSIPLISGREARLPGQAVQ